MRKVRIIAISLLVVLVLLIGMGAGACGGGEVTPPPGDEEEEEVAPPPEEEEEAAPSPALPKPGEWTASTGCDEFTFTFTVSPESTGIPQYTYEFEEFGCGGYHVGKMTGVVTHEEPIPIHPLPSGAEFSFVYDSQVYTGTDPVTGTPIRIYWHIFIEGKFDETGTQASGTWKVSSEGKVHPWEASSEGTTCQTGTWESSH